jgi:hypothetical protein
VDQADVLHLVETILGTQLGDANLDGVVDGSDFNHWNDNKFETCYKTWGEGDFNGDGVADGSDFNIWSMRRFTGGAAAAVPRPDRAPHAPLANRIIAVPQVSDAAWRDFSETNESELRRLPESSAEDAGISPEFVVNTMSRLRSDHGALRNSRHTVDPASPMNDDDAADSELIDSVLSEWRLR